MIVGKATLNPPDLRKLPGLELHEDEPVFSEPWEAQAFALVVGLHQNGAFTWDEWASQLGATIAQDEGSTPYYELWLMALEAMIGVKSLLSDAEISSRSANWRAALLATPHGQPIELGRRHR